MNEQLQAVMRRRGELLAKIDSQRGQVMQFGARWQGTLELADQGLSMLRYLRSRPLLVASVAAVLVWRRRGLAGVAKAGWKLWKGYRFMASLSARLSSH